MSKGQTPSTRKKFLLISAAAFCSATVLRFFTRTKKNETETVKMLTQDGTLVEIDRKLLGQGKKISDAELKGWIKPKTATD